MKPHSEPIPAAAVAFVRDGVNGIEIYLSRRPLHFRYYPGAFVFPGGRVDESDSDTRAAARREISEEIGIEIDSDLLVLLRETHTNPKKGPIYHMWTYAYQVSGEFSTSLNHEEVDEELWIRPADALTSLDIPYQVKVAVSLISQFSNVASLFARLREGYFKGDFYT